MDKQSAKGMTALACLLFAAALCVSAFVLIASKPSQIEIREAFQQRDQALAGLAIAIKDLQTRIKKK